MRRATENRSLILASACLMVLLVAIQAGPLASSEPETATESSTEPPVEAEHGRVWEPHEGDHFWVFPESPDELGSGGEFYVYVDPVTVPAASASFARFELGVGGALPEHRHAKTEEIAYFVSGEGVAVLYRDGEAVDVPVGPGYVWYNPPGAWHSIRNIGDEPLVLVFATIPNEEKGLMSFFREISVKPGEVPTPLPPEEFSRIAAEHDMILRPPPSTEDE